MISLNQWAIKWGIPFEAVEDLRREMGTIDIDPKVKEGESEAAIQTRIRLEGVQKDVKLFRNNVGVLKNKDGVPVRYGLCNDSKQLNKRVKSSDLIGIRKVLITHEHIGSIIGQFVARETKHEVWHYSATEAEQAQLRFLEMIIAMGGDAQFANKVGTL